MNNLFKSLNINKLLLPLLIFPISLFGQAALSVDHNQLNFGFVENGPQTPRQTFFIDNTGSGTINWSAAPNENWIIVSPENGSGPRLIEVFIDVQGMAQGLHSGSISITDPNTINSPQNITVNLTVYSEGNSSSSFGMFDTPVEGSTVNGMINVTGWALDDIEITDVTIYKDVGNGPEYSGLASFVEGARPDVLAAYPNYPNNYQAGWGFMFLTNFAPNGQIIFTAEANDIEGNTTSLGTKTVIIDNANAVLPFGDISTPAQGGIASGTNYPVEGWALTPQPNSIPSTGSAVKIYVDGVEKGIAIYGLYKEDIANTLTNYNNSNGAAFTFDLNTTQYSNGVHSIQAIVMDNVGNSNSIGSRYFTIHNESMLDIENEEMLRIPSTLTISKSFPNPFNPSTTIKYGISKDSRITINIYDLIGTFITSLYMGDQIQGWHTITWNGADDHGVQVPAGIYLAKISANNESKTLKLMLLK